MAMLNLLAKIFQNCACSLDLAIESILVKMQGIS